MNYFFLYQTLKAQFSSGAATHTSGDRAFGFLSKEFHSLNNFPIASDKQTAFDIELNGDNPNANFSYPVFHPLRGQASDGCIILLHGLNERSWDKYLPWGYQLANYTRKTVILFPIAYHMNRSPEAWSNPRLMREYVQQRKASSPDVRSASVANVALSNRLTKCPERFLLSGYQAATDLLELIKSIQSGALSFIKKNSQVDLFGYSIGAFLSHIMMMAHGNDKLSNSRLFIFCGGSAFEDWQGESKFIMDSLAFERLHAFYNQNIMKVKNPKVKEIINNTALGQAFFDLLSLENLKRHGGNYYCSLRDRVSAVVLKNDKVVIADKVKRALKGMRVDEWNFNYSYSHIMPFPVASNKLVNQVNEAFERLMLRASLLFTT